MSAQCPIHSISGLFNPKITFSRFSFIRSVQSQSTGQALDWFRFGGRKHVVLKSIEVIDAACKLEKQGLLDRQEFNIDMLSMLDKGVLSAPAEEWECHKRNVMRYLNPTNGHRELWQTKTTKAVSRALATLRDDQTVYGQRLCRQIAQETIQTIFFGHPRAINPFKLHLLFRLMLFTTELIGLSVVFCKTRPTWIVKSSQWLGKLAGDLLTREIQKADKRKGSPATDPEFQPELRTLLFAGQDTMTCALQNSLWLLANDMEMQQLIRTALRKDANNTQMVDHLIYESFRMLPPLHTSAPRVCLQNIEINGVQIPKDTLVFYGIWQTHQNVENPELFDPNRFATIKPSKTIIPFGSGPKRCVGEQLSYVFLSTALAEIVRQYSISTANQSLHLNPVTLLMNNEKIRFERL